MTHDAPAGNPGLVERSEPAPAGTLRHVIVTVVMYRALLLIVVALAAALLDHVRKRPEPAIRVFDAWPSMPLLSLWIKWDGIEWLAAAAREASPLNTAVFSGWPGYPRLVALAGAVLPLPLAALLVSNVAALASIVVVHASARRELGEERATWATWILLLSPTSYVLWAANAEALLLVAAAATFLAHASGRLVVAMAAAVFGSVVHPAGAALLSVPFVVKWALSDRATRRVPWFVLAGPAALLLLLLLGTEFSADLRALTDPVFRIGPSTEFSLEAVPGAVSWCVALLGTTQLFRERRLDLALYCALCLLLPWFSLASLGRAGLLAFPAWWVLARWSSAAHTRTVVTAALVPWQLAAALLFVLGLSAD